MAEVVLTDDGFVAAAGGVVWRAAAGDSDEDDVEVLLVHRPKYDDWTFPKGKREPGERDDQTAVREVEEETGLQCRLGRELGGAEYRDRRGRPKRVRYWEMTVAGGEFVPGDEVDEIAWLRPVRAAERLTYPHDRAVLDSLGLARD